MDPQLQALYARIKARQISPEEATAQLKLWQAQHQPGSAGLRKETTSQNQADNRLETVQTALIQAASRVLKVAPRDIDGDVELHEYGFDQVKMTELCNHVGEAYSLALTPELLCEYRTLHGIARYLVDAREDVLGERVPTAGSTADAVSDPLRARVTDYFKKLLSSSLKIPLQSIDAHAAMEQYGLNSVLVMTLTNQLEEVFGSLPKTLFFEYQSLDELAAYFLECHGDTLRTILNSEAPVATPASPDAVPILAAELPQPPSQPTGRERRQRQRFTAVSRASGPAPEVFDVAIIGLSGRYPGAENLAQFWDNLKSGRNCITEIPPDRWDWRAYFDAEKGKLGSMYTKWGGFLSAIDKFDPLFFHISPAEAQNMDPQERLFIEEAYAAIEDAGYTPATLGERSATAGPSDRKIGVFVGVMNSTYAPNTRYWSIANRVSYLFDFQGPSMAVDTACSASLTAMHLALESLYRGTCACAIAGGVNLIVDPVHYLGLSVLTMLSPTEQCKAFGDQADGFVDGEGVGALVLKPLARAVEDNDHIYGVIKGSMVNAGGKTNGYTVPNPKAQARLIAEAYQRAGVHPRTISYVEAHGTGTALGDPIEIAGLTRAFAQATGTAHSRDAQFCRIGSVKSNIGHLESASGIAGVTKVLLQLRHRQLVPSLHAKVLNPSLDLEHSPFVVQQELAAWQRPQIEMNGVTREYPRIAGISSFGAGGANAHLIIAEYSADRDADDLRADLSGQPALIVLSAKNETCLKERAWRLLAMLREDGRAWSERDLADMAYTLQVGREAMEERLALIVRSAAELAEKLVGYLAGRDDVVDLFRGRTGGTTPGSIQQDLSIFASDEDLQLALGAWIAKGKYDTLLSLWIKGLAVDWDTLYHDSHHQAGRPRRISLPTYPFAKERYWAHDSTRGTRAVANLATLHPLLHRNTSDLTEQRFSTTLSGREFFLADHVVRGQKVLPAVAYLEMAREALHRAANSLQEGLAEIRLENVVWVRPLVVGDAPVEVHIGLFPEEPGHEAERSVRIAYEIYGRDEGAAAVIYSQGHAHMCAVGDTPVLDLVALQAQCDLGGLDADQCYEVFAAMGLNYGAGHRGIQRLYLGSGQVLAKLVLPDQLRDTDDRFVLHPSLMDAALQAALGLLGQSPATAPAGAAAAPELALPFALREMSISGGCTPAMWAWVRYAETGAGETPTAHGRVRDLDIDVCDKSGTVRARLRGFSFRVLDATAPAVPEQKLAVRALAEDVAQAKTATYLTQLIASAIVLPAHRLDVDTSLEKYGMDSVMAMQLTTQLEKTFGPLSKTLFFEYQDIRTLSGYFLASHPEQLQAVLGVAQDIVPAPDRAVVAAAPAMLASNRRRSRFAALPPLRETTSADIAVIGLAGRYPKANTLDEFWDNLRTGQDCITEVPAERWDSQRYFDPDKNNVGKIYSKWGGFVDDVDRFDPLFFNIAPRDAEIMDPQERLFLECVWHLLENAGHTRALLRAHYQSRIGVYVGAMYQQYHAFDSDPLREAAIAVSSYYSIANRVSYFLDLQGPSMAVDTACSSALVAVHMACESLRHGECQLAIAGGVNLSIHPKKYLGLSLAQIIGSHADSRSFGDGDGYIPAEGVGAVLLKPLARAVRDQDTILAVIKASAINHSGHTHGYAVPNPNAQAQLIIDNFTKAGIDPRTISYVEAAANGSALGDAIELNAMHKAFRQFTADQGFCAIGSVKSNIGHAEAASGMSQLTKVILQLQHGLLAPSIKVEPLNPNLSFDGSPFYLQRELCEWRRPVLDGIGECPRRATVSAIGAGGANAHLIVQEYVAPAGADTMPAVVADAPQIVVFSATNWDRLRAVAEQMLAFVQHNPVCSLAHLAYTLQTGREAMAIRLAMVVTSRDELVRSLEEFLQVVATNPHVYSGALATSVPTFSGDLEGDHAEMRHLLAGKAGEAIVQVFLAEHDLAKLALHWTQGGDVPWHTLHAGMAVRKIALPNYPFARQRYWIQESARQDEPAAADVPVEAQAAGGETAGAITPESFSALSTHDRIKHFLTAVLSKDLGIPMDEIKLNKTFQDYGADSIAVLKMTRGFEEIFQAKLSGRETLEHPTVASLSRYLTEKLESQLPLVTEPARHPLPVDWNATRRDYPQDQRLHQLFEAQVERTPDAVAPYPLSKVQEGLWLLHKFSPHMSAYNVPVALRCTQGFEVDIFRRACVFLLDQYPMLGSLFVEVDGEPRQYIPTQRRFAFEHEVIDHLDERDIIPFLREKVQQPFDLVRGPLMRVHLYSRRHGPEQDHIVLITLHHIVFDGTSSILLASTLMHAYDVLSRGEAPEPVVQEASYEDFVHWEQTMLADQEGREHLAWWQQQLAGELPVLALRTDSPRPAVRGFRGATLEAVLDPSVSVQLKALARSQRVSLSTLLLAIYKILLQRYTGQEDLIVGMPTIGRPKPVFDRVMGCFINMMAVRSRVSGDQSFVDYLKTLQLIMLDSLDHAVYPFSELVRELQVERDQSVSPIFQTYYTYQNYITSINEDSQQAERTGALHTEFLRGMHQEGDKDLGLEVYEEPAHFTLNLKYNPDLYTAATMQRLLEHFTRLAAAVVQQPYGAIAGYDFFSAEQKMAMLRDWNRTDRALPKAQLLFQLFEEQAAKTPDHTAVVFKDQALTYAELDKRSSKLAAYLQQRGVGPETCVGLYLPRCLEIVVGAVGILKAGGVYVPLDPALPEERLAYMIEDANVACLLTTAPLASQAQAFRSRVSQLEVICLDQDWPAIDQCRTLRNPPALQPENLAYVIYTSGSTGRPKGVMIPHSTTIRHCYSIRDYFRIAPGTRVCLQSPISFDASIEQIFAPLSIGATVAIRDLEVLSPKPFSAMLADLQVNVIQLPPALILALFREWQLNPGLIPTALKLLISCGDVLAVETVRLWQSMLKDRVTLLNVYGPTEVTAKATWYQTDPALDTAHLARIPIGRPLANKKIYLLDHYTHPTPIGVPGELHIGGTGPGRGYHGRPALTAEKFIPDPFSDAPGARLYKTGDLAYYRDDGTIEFLGRLDYQVKVRGHRIELGEIEAVLTGYPGVKSAAVISVERGEDRRLVAYLVAPEGHALDQVDLKACLTRQLPDYMVPAAFVCLEQMPLTPSGKINRRALPLPEGMQREGSVAPRDAVELELARIWEEVLAVQSIDIRQDFFALGGHSLLAIRLMVLIEERLGKELPLATLFQAPTIEQLAAVLRQGDARSETTLVPLQALGTQPPFFCVPGAGGTVLYLNELAHHLGQDQPFYAFQAQGLEGRSAPYTSVPQVAERYIQAMRTIQPQGPYLLGGHSFGGRVAFEMARVLERMGQHVQQLVLLDCLAPQPEEPGHAWDDTSLLIAFAGALGLEIDSHVDLLSGLVTDQDQDHQLERLLRALKQHNLVLPDTQSRHFKGLFQVFNTNNQITYVPDGPINAPITLFKASDFQPRIIDPEQFRQVIDDPTILSHIETMHRTWVQFNERRARDQEDTHLGWDRYTTATVTAYDVPGDHMSLVREPHAKTLARAMQACLGG